jgi:MraZ protein
MDRFLSQMTNRLDAKGRVSVPAPFRALLARDGFDGLYVHPALELPAMDCGGNAMLAGIDTVLSQFSPYSEEHEIFATALMGSSQVLKLDGEGRFVITDFIRDVTGIQDQVTFVGLGTKFQIWEPEAFKQRNRAAQTRLAEARSVLSVRLRAGAAT